MKKNREDLLEIFNEKFIELCKLAEEFDKKKFSMSIVVRDADFNANCLMGSAENIGASLGFLMVSEENWELVCHRAIESFLNTEKDDIEMIRKIKSLSKELDGAEGGKLAQTIMKSIPMMDFMVNAAEKKIKEDVLASEDQRKEMMEFLREMKEGRDKMKNSFGFMGEMGEA